MSCQIVNHEKSTSKVVTLLNQTSPNSLNHTQGGIFGEASFGPTSRLRYHDPEASERLDRAAKISTNPQLGPTRAKVLFAQRVNHRIVVLRGGFQITRVFYKLITIIIGQIWAWTFGQTTRPKPSGAQSSYQNPSGG